MHKLLLVMLVALLAMPLLTPVIVSEADALPKCRNVAGYEPKPTCEARNQRAQWQAEQTARMTAQLVVDAMAQQAAADKQAAGEEGGFMATVNSIIDTVVEMVSGLF